MTTRNDVFVECGAIKPIFDQLPEARSQAERIINRALVAVSHPYSITDLERLHLKRAIGWFEKGNYYHACLVVGEAMLPDQIKPPYPLRASQASDFEPLSANDLRLRFEAARRQEPAEPKGWA